MFYEPETPALRETPGVEKKAVPVGQDDMDIVQVFKLLSRTGGVLSTCAMGGRFRSLELLSVLI